MENEMLEANVPNEEVLPTRNIKQELIDINRVLNNFIGSDSFDLLESIATDLKEIEKYLGLDWISFGSKPKDEFANRLYSVTYQNFNKVLADAVTKIHIK